MKRFGKIVGILVIILVLVLLAGHLFIRFYLTEERLKALIIPPAENALGRQVNIGGIKAGLLTGITVQRLAVKEADGRRDFTTVERITLRYDLMKLLHRQLAITEITVVKPEISVIRAVDGSFNYETLAILKPREPGPTAPGTPAAPGKKAWPLAISVSGIHIDDAHLRFSDLTQDMPEIDARADVSLALKLSPDLAHLDLHGTTNLIVDARHGQLAPRVEGAIEFTARRADYDLTLKLDQQKARLHGSVTDFTAGPTVIANLDSADLDLAYLAGLGTAMPEAKPSADTGRKTDKTPKPSAQTPQTAAAPAAGLPPNLKVSGAVNITKAHHQNLVITDLHLTYELAKGMFTLADLRGNCAGGSFGGEVKVDLDIPGLAYGGRVSLKDIAVAELLQMVGGPGNNLVTGTMAAAATFSGRGTAGEIIRDNLDADGTFRLTAGGLSGIPAAAAVADLLGLPQALPEFDDIAGTFQIRTGRARVKSSLTGTGWRARSEGTVGLDGRLDLPLTVILGPELSKALQQKYPWAEELANDQGETEIALAIGGTMQHPQAKINADIARRTVEKTIIRHLDKVLPPRGEGDPRQDGDAAPAEEDKKKNGLPVKQLLQGIFGR